MNQTEAMTVAETFLEEYTRRKNRPEYWDGDDPKVWCQCAAKGDTEDSVVIMFSIQDGENEEDPELRELAKRAMDALLGAHPELRVLDVTYDLSP